MASFYSILSSDDNMIPSSYQSSQLSSDKLYANEPHVSLSYSNLLPENSISAHGIQESESVTVAPHYSDQISQYHGLSLTLGSQEQSLVQMHSDLNHYSNPSFCSMLSSNEINLSRHQNDELKNMQYLSFNSDGRNNTNQEAIKYGATMNNLQPDVTGISSSSKYLKATQELLDELVSVRGVLQNSARNIDSKATDVKLDCVSLEPSESNNNNNAGPELSASERQDLQDKVTKLFGLLDEVDRRYKQYYHQMQAVVSSFDSIAGRGAAQAYTTLALKTISRQFRCLRDAIKKQILSTRKRLGEHDSNPNSIGVLSRLRYVDQQLRQQKALQQFGVMRQPWRPQRGLPESAVSILRAWLFEHFLHPYPKDSEKLVLARQTGLTRGQVANWFINARVRLWKPMIEEMYKEEFGEAETEPKSSPERAIMAQENSSYNEDYHMQSNDLRAHPNAISRAEPSYDNAANFQVDFGLQSKQFLALALQQPEKIDAQQLEGENQAMGNEAATSSSSMVLDKLEYYYTDPVNNQHKFGNSHLLSDFVS